MKEVGLMCIVISQIPESLHCVICFTVCQPKFFPITCVLRLPEVFCLRVVYKQHFVITYMTTAVTLTLQG